MLVRADESNLSVDQNEETGERERWRDRASERWEFRLARLLSGHRPLHLTLVR